MQDEVSSFIEKSMSRGSDYTSAETVLCYLPHLTKRGFVISHMEADELDTDGMQTPNFEYAVLGLDKSRDDDWESHFNANRITNVVTRRLERAVASSKELIFKVWVVDAPDTPDVDAKG